MPDRYFITRTRARGRVIIDKEMEDNEDMTWDRDWDWCRDRVHNSGRDKERERDGGMDRKKD